MNVMLFCVFHVHARDRVNDKLLPTACSFVGELSLSSAWSTIYDIWMSNLRLSGKRLGLQLHYVKLPSHASLPFISDLLRFALTTGYYSLAFGTAQLHADPYLSCFFLALVEIPAYISSWVALRYLPRRLSVISTLMFGAVPLYLIQLVPESKQCN